MRHFHGGWPAQTWKCALWASVLKLWREIYPVCFYCGWQRESRVEEPLKQPTTRMNLSSRTENWSWALTEGRSLRLTISTKLKRKQRHKSWQQQQKSASASTTLNTFQRDRISYSSEIAFGYQDDALSPSNFLWVYLPLLFIKLSFLAVRSCYFDFFQSRFLKWRNQCFLQLFKEKCVSCFLIYSKFVSGVLIEKYPSWKWPWEVFSPISCSGQI